MSFAWWAVFVLWLLWAGYEYDPDLWKKKKKKR